MKTLPNRLHVISFDVPYPADYGGVIDIFHKVQSLHAQGIEIILHMYQYGRSENTVKLKKYCKEMHYYKRRTFKNPFLGSKPYIVNTRKGDSLLERLSKDSAPILFEGLHCTYHLADPSLKDRYKIVRTHNIEHHYYKHLEKSELSYFKKYFFRIEAEKLRKYESVLKHADLIAAISPNDTKYFSKKYKNVIYLPAFHSNNEMSYPGDNGKYLLYHGNLSVPENYIAAMELVKNVFSKVKTKSIIAGNNPPKELTELCAKNDLVDLKTNLTTNEIHKLIKDAHINVLHTNQNTGIKLKLLNALYKGKFAVVNPLMVEGSGLEPLCAIGTNFEAMLARVNEYLLLDYTESYFENRRDYLQSNFGNKSGAELLLQNIDFSTAERPKRRSDSSVLKSLSQLSSFMSYFSL
ncbi:glycosyltransferase family 1 protein [Bacteroidia bacterium]|nr:glycosyltransferase family 1 protein [Bacteroidia bacterium]